MSTFRKVLNITNRVASLAVFLIGAFFVGSNDYAHAAFLISLATYGLVVAGQSDDD